MNKPIRYITIDDNIVDQLTLHEYAKQFPFLQNKGSFNSPVDGLTAISNIAPDLIFLDIEMPGMNGVELLKLIKEKVSVAIFITSHPEYALEGFELSAFDYILKPLTEERFRASMNRLQDYWAMKQNAATYEVLVEQEFIVIKEGYVQTKLPQHEIIYLEAMQDYTKVVTEKKNYLTLTTLTAFLERLSPQKFKRIHRSYAVALNKVTAGGGYNISCGKFNLPIGKTYRSEISKLNL